MTFEEFEKADAEALRAEAKARFEVSKNHQFSVLGTTSLLEAQFYMQELDRQHGDKIAKRDYGMEVWVIRLIALELILAVAGIGLSIKEGHDESRMMDKQDAILTNLQKSSADTSKALANLTTLTTAMTNSTSASANTLLSLRSTTQEMNKGVQSQVAIFYDPSLAMEYDSGENRILFQNTGRSGITLNDVYVDGMKRNLGGPRLISGGTVFYLQVPEVYSSVAAQISAGQIRIVPVEAHLENEIGKKYVMSSSLLFVNESGKVTVHPNTASVRPEP